jgi:hypothetical protein
MRTRLHAIIAVGLLSFGCSPKSTKPLDAGIPPDTQARGIAKQAATAEEEAKKRALENHDGPIDDFFKSNTTVQVPEAREWIKQNPKTFRGGAALEAMLTDLSDAGAQRIIVLTNGFFCDYFVVVILPSDVALRKKVFAGDARFGELSGTGTEKDFGQKYLGHKLNNSMFKPTTTN